MTLLPGYLVRQAEARFAYCDATVLYYVILSENGKIVALDLQREDRVLTNPARALQVR